MPRKFIIRNLALSGTALVSALAFSPAMALAASSSSNSSGSTQIYHADLTSLNKSGTTGTATVQVNGDKVTVTIKTNGASANLPHAQHIHIGGNNVCPTMANDKNKDGIISTVEGQPAYGDVKVSLTSTGDVSAKSAFAMNNYPKADKNGTISYSRTFTLPSGVSAGDLAGGVIVQHGVASLSGDKTKYDGSAKSEIDKNLPLEETAPADCGKLAAATVGGRGAGTSGSTSTPTGAPATGGGSTAGIENPLFFALGGAALIGAGATLFYRKYSSARR